MSREEAVQLFMHEFLHAVFSEFYRQQAEQDMTWNGEIIDAYLDPNDNVWKPRP